MLSKKKKQVPIMSEVWETKDGPRRVRRYRHP